MISVVITGGLVVSKEIISKRSSEYLYLLIRARKKKRKQQIDFIPVIKPLKFNKYLIKQLLRLETGDVVHIRGHLGFINVKLHYPQLTPPTLNMKKMVVFIDDVEWERHIDFKEAPLETFFDIIDDSYLKTLTEDEIAQMESIIEEKLELGKKG